MIYHGIYVFIYDWTYVTQGKEDEMGGRRTDKRLFFSMYTLDVLSNFALLILFYTFDPSIFYYHLVLVP